MPSTLRSRGRSKAAAQLLAASGLLGALAALCAPGAPSADEGDRRYALLIGNSDYAQDSADLRNPANDVRLMADTLGALDFEVMAHVDQDRAGLLDAVRAFSEALEPGGVAMFYYSGHGMQHEGRNWMLPVDADIQAEHEIETEAVDVGRVLGAMEAAGSRINLVVIDACRNNPFERSWRGGAGRGLVAMDAPMGTLIAYATAPGQVAEDGYGDNSPYTEALARAITQPGVEIKDVFVDARVQVLEATQGRQTPWETHSLTGRVVLATEAVSPRGAIEVTVQGLGRVRLDEGAPRLVADGALRFEAVEEGEHQICLGEDCERVRVKAGETEALRLEGAPAGCRIPDPEARRPRYAAAGEEWSNAQGLVFRCVPAGHFTMGAPEAERLTYVSDPEIIATLDGNVQFREHPAHEVFTDAVWVAEVEATQAQLVSLLGFNPTENKKFIAEDWPAASVTWHQAAAFCDAMNPAEGLERCYSCSGEGKKLRCEYAAEAAACAGYRLPTEAEWEKAARAGTSTPWWWGDDPRELSAHVWWKLNAEGHPNPAGAEGHANPWGLQDMLGNMSEWTHDVYVPEHASLGVDNPSNAPWDATATSRRALRGGDFYDYGAENLRAAWREGYHSGNANGQSNGVRCVRRAGP